MKKIARIIGGIALILVGAVLALPLVPGPGIPLMVLGLVILSDHSPLAKRVVDWGKAKLEGIRPTKTPPKKDDPTGTSSTNQG